MREVSDDVKLELAWSLLDLGENEAGLALYSSLPWNTYGEAKYNGIGRALTGMGQNEEAKRVLKRGLQKYPQSCSLWVAMGALHDALGNHSESLRCFEIALQFASEKDYKSVCYNKAVILMKMGCYCDAASIIEYLIDEFPEEAKYHSERAYLSLEMGYPQEALLYYEKALKLYEKSPRTETGVCIFTGLCSTFLALDMKEEAMRVAVEGLTKFPDEDSALYHNLATTLYELGWIGEAKEVLQKGVEKFPNDEELKKFLNDVENDLDDPDGDIKPFLGLLILMALFRKKLRKKSLLSKLIRNAEITT